MRRCSSRRKDRARLGELSSCGCSCSFARTGNFESFEGMEPVEVMLCSSLRGRGSARAINDFSSRKHYRRLY